MHMDNFSKMHEYKSTKGALSRSHDPYKIWNMNVCFGEAWWLSLTFQLQCLVIIIIIIIIIIACCNKKLSYCWETVRRESMPRVAEMDVDMTT